MITWRLAVAITFPVWLIAIPIANYFNGCGLSYKGFKEFILYGYR